MAIAYSVVLRRRIVVIISAITLQVFGRKLLSLCLIFSILSVSAPAAPETIKGIAQDAWQDARFAILSSRIGIDFPNSFTAFFVGKSSPDRQRAISSIRIFPGRTSMKVGEEIAFSGVAYDSRSEPINGVRFAWTSTDVSRSRNARSLVNSTFAPRLAGTYTIRATAAGHQAELQVVVTRPESTAPRNLPSVQISSRSGRVSGSALTNQKEDDGKSPETSENLGEQWDDSNWMSADDPGNLPGNPPGGPADGGAGNGNFQISAPVISLPGRGIDLALNLNYNSRVWSKSGSQLTYDIDHGYPAPGWNLGFGRIMFMGSQGGCMMLDADGTRHGYAGSLSTWQNGMTFTGHTADGSFIDYGCTFNYGNYGTGWAKLPNGTTITYATAHAGNSHVVPTQITDAQGNYITITYRNIPGEKIETITDTMGRVVTFYYDSLNRLTSVEGPRFEIPFETTTRTLLRIHYKPLTLNYSFAGGITPIVRQSTVDVIDAIYYPATNTGYWFGDSDSYSSYGMITKVMEMRGMEWVPGSEEQGTITKEGSMTKQADYNYPLTTSNQTGRTNGIGLTDAPTYTKLTEQWDGRDVEEDAVTTYAFNENDWKHDGTSLSPARSVTITQPSGVISRQYSYRTPNAWTDGLVFTDETVIMDGQNEVIVASSLVSWQQGNQPNNLNYDSPRPAFAKVFDENGHKVKTVYTYGSNKFNQITRSCDYDNSDALLRCSTADYENNAAYIGVFNAQGQFQSGRHIFNLVTSTAIENPSGVKVSRTDYEYDNYQSQPLADAPGVIHHNQRSNPYTTELENGACILWDPPNGEPTCSTEGQQVQYWCGGGYCEGYCECQEYEQVSVYDPSTEKRGNVTKVTTYAEAHIQGGAIYETRAYDMTGNLVKSSSACCEQTSFTYSLDYHYAYPVSQTRGAADPNSPHRITTSAVYDYSTGLVKQTTDANGRTSSTEYNPDTLRPAQSMSSTGAYSTFSYDDTEMTVTEEARESNGTLAGKTKKYLNGMGLVRKEEAYGPGVIDIVETKYDKFGRDWKQSRPYRSGDTVYWSEKFYDLQGRLIKAVEPDGSETKAFYNEASLPDSVVSQPGNRIRVVDAWGRERWGRYDQQGRLIQVVEPNPDRSPNANPTGSVLSPGSLLTTYEYDILGRLEETHQGVQVRKFGYDDLGRLTRQKLAEQTATLNDSGVYVGTGTGAEWSEAFVYDNRSNLIQKTDARGVRTNFSYQLSGGGADPLNRIQLRWYEQTAPADPNNPIHDAPQVSYSYMTTGDKTRISQIRTAGILTEDYQYDIESRVSEYKQTVDYRANYPMKVNYLYDSLDRVKEVTYPEQYGTGFARKIVEHAYDTASRLTSLKFGGVQQASNVVYNASDQTTSIDIGKSEANQIKEEYTFDPQTGLLTNQTAKRNGTETLLNLSYDYSRGNSTGSLNGKTGHLTKVIDNVNNAKNKEYEFDALGRLTKAKGGPTGNLWNQQYSYDRYGNRTDVQSSGNGIDGSTMPADGIPDLAYDNNTNRITTTGFEYDSAGNQITGFAENGTAIKLEYDAANRLVQVKKVSDGSALQGFMYGSTNARLMDIDYAYGPIKLVMSVGGAVLSEYTEFANVTPTWTKSYTYLGDTQLATITPNGASEGYVEYNHPDRLGTRIVTNQASGTSFEQAHLPFGKALTSESSGSTNRRFTSYDRSAPTGLDYAINRTYDSKQGRFAQVDPIGMEAVSFVAPQTLNLYAYCGNDPVNYTDPAGLFFGKLFKWIWKVLKVIVAVVFAIIAVLAFSIGQVEAGIILALASAGIIAETFKIKALQVIVRIASIAVSVYQIRNRPINATPPIFGFDDPVNGGDLATVNIQIDWGTDILQTINNAIGAVVDFLYRFMKEIDAALKAIRGLIRGKLKEFLDNNLKGECLKAMSALGLTKQKILAAFDKTKFRRNPSFDPLHANTSFTRKGKTGSLISARTTTRNGIRNFLVPGGIGGWLLHEVSHPASLLGDSGMYAALLGKVNGLPAVVGKDYSGALSTFFRENCK